MRAPAPVQIAIEVVGVPESGFFTTPAMYTARGPSWSTRNVSMTFYGRSKNWLQEHVAQGHLVLDGDPVFVPRSLSGDRARWRLFDIEQGAHALTQNGYIDTAQLLRTMTMVKMIAETWGFIDADGKPVTDERDVVLPEVRRWARESGLQVGQRGMIPKAIINAYRRAHA